MKIILLIRTAELKYQFDQIVPIFLTNRTPMNNLYVKILYKNFYDIQMA